MELREKIAAIIVEALGDHGIDYGNVKGELAYAEDVIALPEIAEALAKREEIDFPPDFQTFDPDNMPPQHSSEAQKRDT